MELEDEDILRGSTTTRQKDFVVYVYSHNKKVFIDDRGPC